MKADAGRGGARGKELAQGKDMFRDGKITGALPNVIKGDFLSTRIFRMLDATKFLNPFASWAAHQNIEALPHAAAATLASSILKCLTLDQQVSEGSNKISEVNGVELGNLLTAIKTLVYVPAREVLDGFIKFLDKGEGNPSDAMAPHEPYSVSTMTKVIAVLCRISSQKYQSAGERNQTLWLKVLAEAFASRLTLFDASKTDSLLKQGYNKIVSPEEVEDLTTAHLLEQELDMTNQAHFETFIIEWEALHDKYKRSLNDQVHQFGVLYRMLMHIGDSATSEELVARASEADSPYKDVSPIVLQALFLEALILGKRRNRYELTEEGSKSTVAPLPDSAEDAQAIIAKMGQQFLQRYYKTQLEDLKTKRTEKLRSMAIEALVTALVKRDQEEMVQVLLKLWKFDWMDDKLGYSLSMDDVSDIIDAWTGAPEVTPDEVNVPLLFYYSSLSPEETPRRNWYGEKNEASRISIRCKRHSKS